MSRSTHFSTFFCVAIFFTTRCSPIQGFNFFSSNETSQSIQSNHTNSSSDSSETNLYGLTYNTMFSDYNLSESAFPYYASHYIIHPMMNLNNRVANASQSLPKLLATGGERIGVALIPPVNMATNASESVMSAINTTISDPMQVLYLPAQWFGQLNTAVTGMTISALNSTTSSLGNGITSFGGGIQSVGKSVESFGNSVAHLLANQTLQSSKLPISSNTVEGMLLNQASLDLNQTLFE